MLILNIHIFKYSNLQGHTNIEKHSKTNSIAKDVKYYLQNLARKAQRQ